MTLVKHFPVTIVIPHREAEIFTEQAAESAVGQTFSFIDIPVRVKRAWVEHGELFLTLEKVE